MKLMYLGTAAAEGYPALFCTCDRCKTARRLGGKNFRSRSQAIIDNKIIIDFNADSLYHSKLYNIDFTYYKTLLITHVHEDHFVLVEISFRNKGFAMFDDSVTEKLNVYGSQDIEAPLQKYVKDDGNYSFNINVVNAFEPFVAEGYKITPLKATHGTANPFIYIIEKDGKALLYGNDTGVFPEETFDYLKNSSVKLDYVSLDCTAGTNKINYSAHMNYERNVLVKERLIEIGAADKKTVFCLNHFSHNGDNTLYDEMCSVAKKDGFLVSYDGLTVEI